MWLPNSSSNATAVLESEEFACSLNRRVFAGERCWVRGLGIADYRILVIEVIGMQYEKLSVVSLIICIVAPVDAAEDARPGVVLSGAVDYQVQMTTTLVVPAANSSIDVLRVWHALPTPRPWSASKGGVGATGIQASAGGKQQYNQRHDSHHIYWQLAGRQTPGSRHTFTTRFTVRSLQRDFDPKKVSVTWQDYREPPRDPLAEVNRSRTGKVHPQVATLADEIRTSMPPAAAVRAFCRWINSTIKYDASVSYAATDVAASIRHRRGHCGHHAAVLRQFCQHAKIPYRMVRGLNLYQRDGRGALHAIKADYTNVHTWAEVYFPGIGWVEVEPSSGADAYRIPAKMIQNNPWFQNYSIWIREAGAFKQPTWSYNQGKYRSDDGVENVIRFTTRKP